MKEIKLTMGKVALIDDEDYDLVIPYKWQVLKSNRKGVDVEYAKSHIKKHKPYRKLLMHRLIMNIVSDESLTVDHIDGNGLNNQKYNLRVCTQSENARNRKLTRRNTSGYKGVSWCKNRNTWEAYVTLDKKKINLGYHKTLIGAAMAYNVAAQKYHGEFAVLNSIIQ